MTTQREITALYLDIGGVLLTNGWDRHMRRKAAERFGLDDEELNERHHLSFDAYEEGKLSLDDYLNMVVFHEKRQFARNTFKEFMFAQTQPISEAIETFRMVAANNSIKIGAISNEGRELTIYRINHFGLKDFIQFFICSSFVHMRKPDRDMFIMALDVGQTMPEHSLYIDDRRLYVEVAGRLGMNVIHHTDINRTRHMLAEYGLAVPQEAHAAR